MMRLWNRFGESFGRTSFWLTAVSPLVSEYNILVDLSVGGGGVVLSVCLVYGSTGSICAKAPYLPLALDLRK